MLWLLPPLIWCAVFISSSNAGFNFDPIPPNTPLLVNNLVDAQLTYNSYRLMAYADLSQLFELKFNIRRSIKLSKEVADMLGKPAYINLVNQAEHQFKLMDEDDDLLNAFRTRRFVLCEFCGNIQHFLYGVMDADTARSYDDRINEISNATMHQHELIKNQTKIFRDSILFNKNTFHNIESQIIKIHQLFDIESNKTNTDLTNIQREIQEQNLIQLIQLMLSEYHRLFDRIRRTLMDARAGRINELIPKKQLVSDLKFINERLDSTQQLPINPNTEDAFHIYKYSGILSTIHNGKIFMEISIPVAEREKFRLYKATAIPMWTNHTYAITSVYSTYFLLSRDYTKYIPIGRKQLDMGRMLPNHRMLYKTTATILTSPANICEWKMIADRGNIHNACKFTPYIQPNTLIMIIESELYYLAITNDTVLYEACNGTDYIPRTIDQSGIIRLDPSCTIKTSDYIVRGHKTIQINSSSLILPSISPLKLNLSAFNETILNRIKSKPLPGDLAIIHNPDELNEIIEKSNELVAMAGSELKIDEIHYESTSSSLFSGAFSGFISSMTIFLTIGGIFAALFYKANLFSCLLRAIIKRSTVNGIDHDGRINVELPLKLTPRKFNNRSSIDYTDENTTTHQQSHTDQIIHEGTPNRCCTTSINNIHTSQTLTH